MKILDEYYVLMRPGTKNKNNMYTPSDTDTVFLGKDDEFVDDVRHALKIGGRKTAELIISDYEQRYNIKSSCFIAILVRNEITF